MSPSAGQALVLAALGLPLAILLLLGIWRRLRPTRGALSSDAEAAAKRAEWRAAIAALLTQAGGLLQRSYRSFRRESRWSVFAPRPGDENDDDLANGGWIFLLTRLFTLPLWPLVFGLNLLLLIRIGEALFPPSDHPLSLPFTHQQTSPAAAWVGLLLACFQSLAIVSLAYSRPSRKLTPAVMVAAALAFEGVGAYVMFATGEDGGRGVSAPGLMAALSLVIAVAAMHASEWGYTMVLAPLLDLLAIGLQTAAAGAGSGLVFICAKSEDYDHARRVYAHLQDHGIPAFFSDVSLRQMGDADYRHRIDIALDAARHMVVVTSSKQNAEAPWVEAEWGFFISEKRSGRKGGNVITVVVGSLKPEGLPPSLRYYEVRSWSSETAQWLLEYLRDIGRDPSAPQHPLAGPMPPAR